MRREISERLAPWSARSAIDVGMVLVRVLEHPAALDDERLLGLLDWSSGERQRIQRFRHQGAKTSWCLSRWMLREALRELAGIRDANRALEYGEFGKPFIPDCALTFNWSHAEGCVALVLASDRDVGVDIEVAALPRVEYLDIVQSFFRLEEMEWIGHDPGMESWQRFVSLFVQKEAWLKATGRGLSLPLSEAPAALKLPPSRDEGRMLATAGRSDRYFLAVDASIGAEILETRFEVEYRSLTETDESGF
jgi:4'-phosphopantetheinyl transferase